MNYGNPFVPSVHLDSRNSFYESPQEAAKRILREQLDLDLALSGPHVVSEAYTPKRFPELPRHWDIEFIFKGKLSEDHIPKPYAWSKLAFINLDATKKSEIARSHEDILEYAGLVFKHS